MDAKPGKDMRQIWKDHETDITKKVTNSQAVTTNDLHRAATAAASKPAARLPESTFLQALGTPNIRNAPPLGCLPIVSAFSPRVFYLIY